MAMPFSRGKQIERALMGRDEFPDNYKGSKTKEELTALFDKCFELREQASVAKGKVIPIIIENVKGAQKWVGRSRWNFGSYHLWGDVPALMPIAINAAKNHGEKSLDWNASSRKGSGSTWFYQNGGNGRSADSQSLERKTWSALIAKIPFDLSSHIARVFKPSAY